LAAFDGWIETGKPDDVFQESPEVVDYQRPILTPRVLSSGFVRFRPIWFPRKRRD